jgi:hypothetical protein
LSWCCGDGFCEGDENNTNCEIDCSSTPVICGDLICDDGEDQCNCSKDCGIPPVVEKDCADNIDNDCDGLIDSDDTDCTCLDRGESCTSNGECCSIRCHRGVCK